MSNTKLTDDLVSALNDVLNHDKTFVVKQCKFCENGYKIAPCRRCNETGKLETGEICPTCKGKKIYVYKPTRKFSGKKCPKCLGTGTVVFPLKKF